VVINSKRTFINYDSCEKMEVAQIEGTMREKAKMVQ
jgi:hypothetical protein